MTKQDVINSDEYYRLYEKTINRVITPEEASIRSYDKTKKYTIDKLESYRDVLVAARIDFERITNASNAEIVDYFSRCIFNIADGQSLSELTRLTRNIIVCNKLIKRAEIKIRNSGDKALTKPIYKSILKELNKEIVSVILEKGYTYTYLVGSIRIKKHEVDHTKQRINWGESIKLKQQIIDRGGIPYQAYRNDDLVKIGDNGGEPWFIYFTNDYDYWVVWDKKTCRSKNGIYYSLKVSNQLKDKVLDIKRNRPELLERYSD